MTRKYKSSYPFLPFACTQIQEEQNYYLISNDFLQENFFEFNDLLYKYVDKTPIYQSFYRMFNFKRKTVLVYYWVSQLEEPRTHRKGIFLISGVICDTHVFYRNPVGMHNSLKTLLEIIMRTYQSDDCDKILQTIWDSKKNNSDFPNNNTIRYDYTNHGGIGTFSHIKAEFFNACFYYLDRNVPIIYQRRHRIGKCQIHLYLPSQSSSDISLFFISEVANWAYSLGRRADVSSIEGCGKRYIRVHLNDEGIPANMISAKLVRRFDTAFLEIRTS